MDRQEARRRAEELVSQMTVEEMASQLRYDAPAIERLGIPAYNWWNEGLHGVARAGTATVFPQAIALGATYDDDLLGRIGSAVGVEARAKYNAARELDDRDIYKGITLWSPNVNLFRDPRWGRGQETYGEDPELISRLAVEFIKGLQGKRLHQDGYMENEPSYADSDLSPDGGGSEDEDLVSAHEGEGEKALSAADDGYLLTAACAKHFAVHSGPEALRHEFDALTSMKDLWETYLPAFEACVKEAGVEAVMGAYNRTNGEPCCAHSYLMEDVLRGKWGFEGHYVSDCWALRDFHENHHVTGSSEESAVLALKLGCDVNCGCTYQDIMSAYREWNLSEEWIRRSCERLFTTRFMLGMFDETSYDRIPLDVVDSKKHRDLAARAVRESVVLLKNDGILPLRRAEIAEEGKKEGNDPVPAPVSGNGPDDTGKQKPAQDSPKLYLADGTPVRSIAVIGPNADDRAPLLGNYHGTSPQYITILDGIWKLAGEDVRIRCAKGCHKFLDRDENLADRDDRVAEAIACAEHSDLVILCTGLDETLEGEEGDTGNAYASGDKEDLQLPKSQIRLMQAVFSTGKPVIMLNLTGSCVDLTYADLHARAVLQCWYPGGRGGLEIARILFGESAPSGKLPVTFYRDLRWFPEFTDYSMKGRTYRFLIRDPLYPFGYGLTYGKLCVDGISVPANAAGADSSANIETGSEHAAGPADAAAGPENTAGTTYKAKVTITNPGEDPVEDVLQIYTRIEDSEWENGHPKLAAFSRVRLMGGETKTVEVVIPERALTVVTDAGERIRDGSKAVIYAGFGQPDGRTYELTGNAAREAEVQL